MFRPKRIGASDALAILIQHDARVSSLFRYVRKRLFIHASGVGARAECGASAEGWRECFALRLFFGNEILALKLVWVTAGLSPEAPSAPAGRRQSLAICCGAFFAASEAFLVLHSSNVTSSFVICPGENILQQ
jgi:hypothetical protein